MLTKYSHPPEMPKIVIDDDGILNVHFGTIMVTVEHVVYRADIQRKLAPGRKLPVMVVGEAAVSVRVKIAEMCRSKWVADVTSAMAVVSPTKVGRVLGNIFMSIHKNPYPTKLFDNEEDALAWLRQYLKPDQGK
ncbi:MAG: hypothetical protein KAI89_04560 [Emcibacter sp.]|nr:hypothetical protein [Emcibacter sp.]